MIISCRVRFNAASIAVKDSQEGEKFEQIEDIIVVYISQFDIFKADRVLYHVDSTIRETGNRVDDGLYRVFVNTEVKRRNYSFGVYGMFP